MAVEVGKKAPAFRLKDAAEKTVSLSDYAGRWVVLYFYPKDDTPGCTTEACEFTASIRDFQGLDADVVGVKRSTVIVDPAGKVAHRWKSVKAAGHAAAVAAKLKELQAA